MEGESKTLNWLAGLAEAEGTFLRPPPSAPNTPRVAVRMTDRDVVVRVAALFGVSLVEAGKGRYKPEFGATLRGQPAVDLMRDLRPMLGVRRRLAVDRAVEAHQPTRAKLAGVQCARIQQLAGEGRSVSSLARVYRVSRPTVRAAFAWEPTPEPVPPWRLRLVPAVEVLEFDGISGDDFAWLEGWLEGEGSFLPGPPSDPGRPRITASCMDRDVAARAAGLLGVGVGESHPSRAREAGWSPLWRFVCAGTRAQALMAAMRPGMSDRRQLQIDRALAGSAALAPMT